MCSIFSIKKEKNQKEEEERDKRKTEKDKIKERRRKEKEGESIKKEKQTWRRFKNKHWFIDQTANSLYIYRFSLGFWVIFIHFLILNHYYHPSKS